MITIFTDGSSRGNPGPGGWAAVIVGERGKEKGRTEVHVTELGGAEKLTTNNRMELTAAVEALGHIAEDSSAVVHTDSRYVINGITKWIKGWKRNGWVTKAKEDVLNKDLWMRLDASAQGKHIEWKYVGGHSGIVGNERCDHIATDLADGMDMKLYDGPLSGYDLPAILDISLDPGRATAKKKSSERTKAPAHSYVSSVGGIIEIHHSWPECEKRVKGARGAKYKKSISADDEQKIINEFEAL